MNDDTNDQDNDESSMILNGCLVINKTYNPLIIRSLAQDNNMYLFALFLLSFQLCCSQNWIDQCGGSVLLANQASKIAVTSEVNHYTGTKKLWEACAHCVNAVGRRRCSAPTMAVSVTCECTVNNPQTCRCRDHLSMGGIIVICILGPLLGFFGIVLLIFLSNAKARRRPTGFNVCFVFICFLFPL